ncbi:RNA polymerase sigma factor [Novipirellula maiorica]|nr:sigma-70 family RNA polymerase sigma factor [Rhodopirellula maiorica]
MSETPLSLIDRVRFSGDDASWAELVELYTPFLQRWAAKFQIQSSDCNDLVQDVLMTVHQNVNSFEHSGRSGAFRAWLRSILVHRISNYWRKRKNAAVGQGGSDFHDLLQTMSDPNSNLSQLWEREHDAFVLAHLLDRVRVRFTPTSFEAFHRTALRGESAAQVAADLKISVNAVFVAKSRILSELRRQSQTLI